MTGFEMISPSAILFDEFRDIEPTPAPG